MASTPILMSGLIGLSNNVLFAVKLAIRRYMLTFGFAFWLWAFLFARIPLAVIQDLVGLDSRPFVLINLISVGIAAFIIFDKGLATHRVLLSRWMLIGVGAFVGFWLIYLLRLLFDSYIIPIEFFQSSFALVKSFVNTTLVPIVCLPLILSVSPNRYSLDLCVGLGSLSVLSGEIAYVTRPVVDRLFDTRFSFEDLNPIPAGYSSASLVILGILILFLGRHYLQRSDAFWCRTNAIFAILVGLWGIQLSQTRSAFLSIIPMFIFCLYALWLARRELGWLFSGGLALFIALCAPLVVGLLGRGISSDPSVVGRLILIKESFHLIIQHPFLGTGFQSQGLLKSVAEPLPLWYPHNLFLETYLIGGLFLLLLLLMFISIVLKQGSICLRSHDFQDHDSLMLSAVFFLWVQAFIHSLFSGHLALIPGFWVGGMIVIILGSQKLSVQYD
ncbi:O-antigen ligase [Synechococcus sp. MVIR-18-1]|uniref:O-antigen ligase family protein n=1 Tax=Synechococcus sp. MVIR-18-1 TaxID=1386941 RepID=UPI0016487AA6|nr:O-antigen ligase family protein [Synechococcus sp. MVIR-18-1]QNI75288.1 O-Antigen ligase family protein [Synechococcus sp. MVIR-18-1]